jgi:hypothetical protein
VGATGQSNMTSAPNHSALAATPIIIYLFFLHSRQSPYYEKQHTNQFYVSITSVDFIYNTLNGT